MTERHGLPIWYELATDDPDAAERFYGAVLGWRFSRPPGGLERDYRIAASDGTGEGAAAGFMRPPAGSPMGSTWLIYFMADDVDAAAAETEAAGGRVHLPGTDIPGVGRIAFLTDPAGLPFYVMRRADGVPAGGAFRPAGEERPGHPVWNELTSPDPEGALAFYGRLFGLRQDGAMPMGPLGDYRFLKVGETPVGALMGEVPGGRPGWQVYFMVAEIDAAAARLREAGGTILQGPDEIPGGDYSIVAADDRGARFGLVGPRR